MANEPKMKIGIGADTGDFDKGAKKVKQEMKDLSKVSSDAFGAIGNAIGVDTGKLGQMSSALQGLGNKFQQMGTAGANSFGAILKSIAPVGVAIAGLGIAGATFAFKELTAEAEMFKKTVEGTNLELQTQAYIDTYRMYMSNALGTGQSLAEAESSWKRAWNSFKIDVSTYFTSGAWKEAFNNPWIDKPTIDAWSAASDKAAMAASASAVKTSEIFELERKRKEQAIEIEDLHRRIVESERIYKDLSNDTATREYALAEWEGLIYAIKRRTVPLEQTLADLYQERSNLAPDDVAAADATLEQKRRAVAAEREIEELLKARTRAVNTLVRQQNQLAAAAEREADAQGKAYEAQKEIMKAREKEIIDEFKLRKQLLSGGTLTTDTAWGYDMGIPAVNIELKGTLANPSDDELQQYTNFLSMGIGPVKLRFMTEDLAKAKSKIIDISKEIENTIKSGITGMAEAIGDMLAAFTNGENGWKAFANSALSALGDMAIGVGKIAIETGVAMLGIKAALETLGTAGPYVAIAAGAALVALGTWAKSSLSNVANGGNYSSSASTVTSSAASYGGNFEQRDVYVNVEGTLRADGDQLIAVINNSNKKKYVTT